MNNFESKLKAGNFVYNNGAVLRTMNILSGKFHKLSGIAQVLKGESISEGEFLESVNFLTEDRYIRLRRTCDKSDALLADNDYTELEALLTSKGIRLTKNNIKDDLIDW